MLDVFSIAKPQNCDIQIFYGFATTNVGTEWQNWRTWNKPRGVSHIYMMLIGAGGKGSSTDGGGSGAVTVWYGAAQHVPDSLQIHIRQDSSAQNTTIAYRSTTSAPITLLEAEGSNTVTGGGTTAASAFAASGFYQSVAGQAGATGTQSASATTFLSGGAGGAVLSITANYGYQTNVTGSNGAGYFQLQPIIVGVGGASTTNTAVGCGSSKNGISGGQGMVLIASW